jgi:hypothetical protein
LVKFVPEVLILVVIPFLFLAVAVEIFSKDATPAFVQQPTQLSY